MADPLVHLAKVIQLRGQIGEFRGGRRQCNGPPIDFIQSQFNFNIIACSVHMNLYASYQHQRSQCKEYAI
jgi:hypothetical protein